MFQLNLPQFETNLRQQGGKPFIYDILRRRYICLTPEEWVRQHFVHYLIHCKGYPQALMANEVSITLNGMWRRCDTVVYRRDMTPFIIIEYKAPTVRITEETFRQACAYNHALRVPYLIVSNGLDHYVCHADFATGALQFLPGVPDYADLCPTPTADCSSEKKS